MLFPANTAQSWPLRLQLVGEQRQHRITAKRVVVDDILVAEGDPDDTRWPISVATACSTSFADRPSEKQPANRSISRIARSVAPKQRAGIRCHASAIEAGHHSTALDPSKSNSPGLHSVGIGDLRQLAEAVVANRLLPVPSPDAATSCEKCGLALDASALVMVHNHPSNYPHPSKPDIEMTRQVRDALDRVGIVLHDHLIISRGGHTSFRQLGLLEVKAR